MQSTTIIVCTVRTPKFHNERLCIDVMLHVLCGYTIVVRYFSIINYYSCWTTYMYTAEWSSLVKYLYIYIYLIQVQQWRLRNVTSYTRKTFYTNRSNIIIVAVLYSSGVFAQKQFARHTDLVSRDGRRVHCMSKCHIYTVCSRFAWWGAAAGTAKEGIPRAQL